MSLPVPTPRTVAEAQPNWDWLADRILVGVVDPSGVVAASPGTLYIQEGAAAALWFKGSGNDTSGWVAK